MFEVPAKTWRDDEFPLFNVERRGNNIIYIKLFHNDETNIYQSVLKYIPLSRYYLDRTGPGVDMRNPQSSSLTCQ